MGVGSDLMYSTTVGLQHYTKRKLFRYSLTVSGQSDACASSKVRWLLPFMSSSTNQVQVQVRLLRFLMYEEDGSSLFKGWSQAKQPKVQAQVQLLVPCKQVQVQGLVRLQAPTLWSCTLTCKDTVLINARHVCAWTGLQTVYTLS